MEIDRTDIVYIINNYDIKDETLREIYQKLLKEIEQEEQPIKEQLAEIEDLKRRNK